MSHRTVAALTGTALTTAAIVASALSATAGATPAAHPAHPAHQTKAPAAHVLLISVDGLHQSDLDQYVAAHPQSALARLVGTGTTYTHASTTFPSDSFPGMIAQLTGGTAGTAGVYYDDTYNRSFFAPGTRDCSGKPTGSEISWTEAADRSQNPITLDAGQGLTDPALKALPTNTLQQTLAAKTAITKAILKMTPTPQSLLDPAALPVNPTTCLPEYPHDYLRVNTVFNVVRAHHLRTAWSDKHAAYEILNGPSGNGIQDLFTPEINSVADSAGDDWTTDNALTQEYDSTKVAAVLNEIDGFDHSRTHKVGTPAVFGLNFQSVSTAQKLPSSDGMTGGYLANGMPGPLLSNALAFVDRSLARLINRIHHDKLAASTTIILSAKHGQSPINKAALRRVDDGAIIDALNSGWHAEHPSAAPLVSFSVDDDVMLLWLSNRSAAAFDYVSTYLHSHSAPANTINDPKGTFSATVASSGLSKIYTGKAADAFVGAAAGDPHAPDLIGIVQHGVVYTGKTGKIAEHGGNSTDDRHVALVVAGAGVHHGATVTRSVQTTQIAPTILTLLGLNPRQLQAVRIDHTAVLPTH